jgi:hypothetical protein
MLASIDSHAAKVAIDCAETSAQAAVRGYR